ncbi:WD40-repeat-containing domain protein [Tribonema minus]|uniref:WD40-repeat-containing domain protein n=1 Tax=Tribonema minus TaxID=303371 RepID=A0A835YN47_9STRA|nr:WD40-repeat-containing domain protein [Tribonema minus]
MAEEAVCALDGASLAALRTAFAPFLREGKDIPFASFVTEVFRHLSARKAAARLARAKGADRRLIKSMSALFDLIDIDGRGAVDWESFTKFYVDLGGLSSFSLLRSVCAQGHRSGGSAAAAAAAARNSTKTTAAGGAAQRLSAGGTGAALLQEQAGSGAVDAKDGDRTRALGALFYREKAHFLDRTSHCMEISSLKFVPELGLLLVVEGGQPALSVYSRGMRKAMEVHPAAAVRAERQAEATRRLLREMQKARLTRRGLAEYLGHKRRTQTGLKLCEEMDVLASWGGDEFEHSVWIWDIDAGSVLRKISGHLSHVKDAVELATRLPDPSFPQDGLSTPLLDLLLSAGFDSVAYAWDRGSATAHPALTLVGHHASLVGIAVVPHTLRGRVRDSLAVTLDVAGTARVWALERGAPAGRAPCLQTFAFHNVGSSRVPLPRPRCLCVAWDQQATAFCVDARHKKVVMGDQAGNVGMYSTLNGSRAALAAGHTNEISGLVFAEEPSAATGIGSACALISVGWDRSIAVHDAQLHGPRLLRRMHPAHDGDISQLAFSADLQLIATAASDLTIRLWDYSLLALDAVCVGHRHDVAALRFLHPLPAIASAEARGRVMIWATRPAAAAGSLLWAMNSSALVPTPLGQPEEKEDNDYSEQLGGGQGGGAVAVVPTCLEWHWEGGGARRCGTLLAGDESGLVHQWDLTRVLTGRLGLEPRSVATGGVNFKSDLKHERGGATLREEEHIRGGALEGVETRKACRLKALLVLAEQLREGRELQPLMSLAQAQPAAAVAARPAAPVRQGTLQTRHGIATTSSTSPTNDQPRHSGAGADGVTALQVAVDDVPTARDSSLSPVLSPATMPPGSRASGHRGSVLGVGGGARGTSGRRRRSMEQQGGRASGKGEGVGGGRGKGGDEGVGGVARDDLVAQAFRQVTQGRDGDSDASGIAILTCALDMTVRLWSWEVTPKDAKQAAISLTP